MQNFSFQLLAVTKLLSFEVLELCPFFKYYLTNRWLDEIEVAITFDLSA